MLPVITSLLQIQFNKLNNLSFRLVQAFFVDVHCFFHSGHRVCEVAYVKNLFVVVCYHQMTPIVVHASLKESIFSTYQTDLGSKNVHYKLVDATVIFMFALLQEP